jgi:hypothetical protein
MNTVPNTPRPTGFTREAQFDKTTWDRTQGPASKIISSSTVKVSSTTKGTSFRVNIPKRSVTQYHPFKLYGSGSTWRVRDGSVFVNGFGDLGSSLVTGYGSSVPGTDQCLSAGINPYSNKGLNNGVSADISGIGASYFWISYTLPTVGENRNQDGTGSVITLNTSPVGIVYGSVAQVDNPKINGTIMATGEAVQEWWISYPASDAYHTMLGQVSSGAVVNQFQNGDLNIYAPYQLVDDLIQVYHIPMVQRFRGEWLLLERYFSGDVVTTTGGGFTDTLVLYPSLGSIYHPVLGPSNGGPEWGPLHGVSTFPDPWIQLAHF